VVKGGHGFRFSFLWRNDVKGRAAHRESVVLDYSG
jgi:hypothetical protein